MVKKKEKMLISAVDYPVAVNTLDGEVITVSPRQKIKLTVDLPAKLPKGLVIKEIGG